MMLSKTFGIMENIKWLFFDMGSTLIDESKAQEHRICEVIAGTNITYEQFMEKKIYFAKQNKPADLETIKYYGLTKTPWHKEDEFLYPDAEICLRKLHESFKIGIIANQSLGSEERLKKYGLLETIDLVVASAEEGVAKPDVRIFELALERAVCSADEAVMIGDRLDNDIVPANKIGMHTIWIKQGDWRFASPVLDLEKPEIEFDNLTELYRAFI